MECGGAGAALAAYWDVPAQPTSWEPVERVRGAVQESLNFVGGRCGTAAPGCGSHRRGACATLFQRAGHWASAPPNQSAAGGGALHTQRDEVRFDISPLPA